ncbi:MAG TPA: cytochrome c [Stellaceae bacterium]|nr:cytochrome c [Stellaceae bacterium]
MSGSIICAAAKTSKSDEEAAGLFASTCGFCHEDGGRSAGKGPKLADTKRSDAFITNRIKHGKEGAMPAFGDAFTNKQIKGIIHYIRGLKSE